MFVQAKLTMSGSFYASNGRDFMPERRQSARQKSLFRGIVYFDNSPCATECLVRDISETGARIKFSAVPAGATDVLELQIPLRGQKHKCKVKWRLDDEIGVAFLHEGASHMEDASIADRMNRLEHEIAALKQVIKRLQRDSESTADVA